jgi:hypothetical protein
MLKLFAHGGIMVKHGAISRAHVYDMLRSKHVHVRRAAFTLLEASNPSLRRDSGLFIEIVQFIWDANPSYDVYQEFSERHFVRRYKVHELIIARLKREKQAQKIATTAQRIEHARQPARGFFKRLFWQATTHSLAAISSVNIKLPARIVSHSEKG